MKKNFKILTCLMASLLVLGSCGNNPGSGSNTDTTPPSTETSKDFTGLTLSEAEFTYDGQPHSLAISGTIPEGATVSYTGNEKTDAGVYDVKAVVKKEGYTTLNLTAKMTIKKAPITGITLSDSEVTFDGKQHSLAIDGTLPDGVSVTYENNGKVDAGAYTVKATLSGSNYLTEVLTAKLTIKKAPIEGLTFEGASYEYDQKPHSLKIVGNVPTDVTIKYFYNEEEKDSVQEVGEYKVKAVLEGKNHVTTTLTATLKINSTEKELFSTGFKNEVYFQNDLDGDRLYKVTSNGTLKKVNNDNATYFTSDSKNLYYSAKSLLQGSIKQIENNVVTSLVTANAKHLSSDGNYLYYSINNLVDTKDENGIYKLSLVDGNLEPVKLVADKADGLVVNNGYLYYINASLKERLFKIKADGTETVGTQITENKVVDLVSQANKIYYTEKSLTNSQIFSYNTLTAEVKKLCIDNGGYLTVIGNYLYYVNKDLLTSTLFGKGIYKVSINGGTPTKIVEDQDNGFSSLSTDGTNLYYYKLNNKHFYKNSTAGDNEVDLMQNFVPIDDTVVTGYSKVKNYNGEIYFTNMRDNGYLYKYNPQKRECYSLVSESVSDFWFNDGYIYYSTYILTNYALFKYNIETGETVKISSSRCDHLMFDGEYIYYLKVGSAYNNHLMKMKNDGTEVTELYKGKNIHIISMEKVGDDIFFVTNEALKKKELHKYSITTKEVTSLGVHAEQFKVFRGQIYFFDQVDKELKTYNLSTGTVTVKVNDVDINYITAVGNTLYYSSVSNSYYGVFGYKYEGELIHIKALTSPCSALTVIGNKLYYQDAVVSYQNDYPVVDKKSKGNLNVIDLKSRETEKIA